MELRGFYRARNCAHVKSTCDGNPTGLMKTSFIKTETNIVNKGLSFPWQGRIGKVGLVYVKPVTEQS